jgi:hypothetical protein
MPFDFPEVLAAIAPRGLSMPDDTNFDGWSEEVYCGAQPVFELVERRTVGGGLPIAGMIFRMR